VPKLKQLKYRNEKYMSPEETSEKEQYANWKAPESSNIIDFKTAKAKLENKDLPTPEENFITAAVDYISAHPTDKGRLIDHLVELAKTAGISDQREITSLDLISMPLTGDIYADTMMLGKQIKDPDVALYLQQGAPPSEILNEIKRGATEWLSNESNKPVGTIIHSKVMIGIIDKILQTKN